MHFKNSDGLWNLKHCDEISKILNVFQKNEFWKILEDVQYFEWFSEIVNDYNAFNGFWNYFMDCDEALYILKDVMDSDGV